MDKYPDQLTTEVTRLNVNKACDDVVACQFELKLLTIHRLLFQAL